MQSERYLKQYFIRNETANNKFSNNQNIPPARWLDSKNISLFGFRNLCWRNFNNILP